MKLSEYAKRLGITYRTAWSHFDKGLIDGAYQLSTGTVIVPDGVEKDKRVKTSIYCRVSSSENKSNLKSQSDRLQAFCAAKGWEVDKIVEEFGSGLNDSRPKLISLLKDPTVGRIVVEHRSVLPKFSFDFVNEIWTGELVTINNV